MTAFQQAVAIVLASEGGYTRNQADPGNWTGGRCGLGELRGTNFGISAASYPLLDIAALSIDDARTLYKRDYWDRVRGDELPPPLALLTFDAAVNNGVGRAARWLQQACGAVPDGAIGPATLAAVASRASPDGGVAVCAEFLALRMLFMASLPTWPVFGGGWARRLAHLPYQSMTIQAPS